MQSEPSKEHVFFRWIDKVVSLFETLALLALWAMACLLMYDIILRYVLDRSSDWSLDVVQLVQVTLAFAAAAPVLRIGGHINMEALPALLSAHTRHGLDMLSNGICTLGCLYMVVISWRTFVRSYEMSELAYAVAIPLSPWKLFIVLSFFLLALQFFRSFVGNVRARSA
ncbi:TRAP transporter small permease [Castellaniella sp. GW247-6E4]|uniref:TRAP transporter small permease n=1 Tax=Castellaniella sp. GW247-6E4 TaxID=3140380 RepID=UPI0033149262